MTLATTETRKDYVAGAAQTKFPYTFKIFKDTELLVYQDGILKTLTVDYTVTNVGVDSGGDVVFGAGLAGGEEIAILRSVSGTQETDYTDYGDFPAESHEDALDKLTMLHLQQLEELGRAIKFAKFSKSSSFDMPEPEAGKALVWNELGTALVNLAGALGDFKGNWATGVNYKLYDIMIDAGGVIGLDNVYVANTAHLSSPSLATDTAKWTLLIDVVDILAKATAATAADVVLTNADVVTTNNNVTATNNDVVTTNNNVIATNADVVTTNNNVIATNNDVIATNADVVTTNNNVTAAGNAQAAAEAAQAAAEAVEDNIDDRFLGSKASDPTLDNDGNALLDGARYWNSVSKKEKIYDLATATWNAIDNGVGKRTLFIPASAMLSRTTNGAAHASTETTTNKVMIKTLDFDSAADNFAQFSVKMPKSWNAGAVTAQFKWSHAATTVNFGVKFFIQAVAYANDDALDTAFGTAVGAAADTGGVTDNIYFTDETAAITLSNTPSKEDYATFQVYRDVSDAGDTMAIDARLHGVVLYITTDAANDA